MRHGRWVAGGLAWWMAAGLLSGCTGGSSPTAPQTASSFVTAWNRSEASAMQAMIDQPGPGFAAAPPEFTARLHATAVARHLGLVTVTGSDATAALSSTYTLPGVGPWTVSTSLHLHRHGSRWEVEWSPSAIAPGLSAGDSLAVSYTWAPRAPILGAGGADLTVQQPEVIVGLEGSRLKSQATVTSVLEASGAPASAISTALAGAAAHPTYFEPVFTITEARFQQLGGDQGDLYKVSGTVFQHTSARAALTPGLGAHLVGSVGPITAEELTQLGSPYDASSVVGQTGLEAAYQKQLAGRAGATVQMVDAHGKTLATLATFNPVAGTPVSTSIDPTVQQAAETALASVTGSAAFVAVRVSTGQVLAVASLPAANQFDAALDGEFPPGSTFKVITSAALFAAGLSASSPASCPPQITVDGEPFHNAEGDNPVSTLFQAFTESCNTAFVQLATAHLKASDFTTAASQFGIGAPFQMGVPAFAGRVPAPTDGADLAQTSIGQASVVLSPLEMAMVAAAVGRGSVAPPRLVTGAPDDTATDRPLPATTVSELRSMMASVVASGTAAGTGLPAGTFAKTGTAQYGSGNPLPTDAWLMGYRGDIAFAMVEQDSTGNGGPVDGPIVARFLAALPPSAG